MTRVTIRAGTPEDFPQLVELGRHFHACTQYQEVPYSPESVGRWLELIDQQRMLMVAGREGEIIGVAGGIIAPLFFNDTYRIGQELFWWVEPAYRRGRIGIDLLRAIERRAQEAGCKYWSMLALEAMKSDRVASIYERFGYRVTEHTYTKVL